MDMEEVRKKWANVRLSDPRQSLIDLFNAEDSEDHKEASSEDKEPKRESEGGESDESADEEPNTEDRKFIKPEAEDSSDPEYEPTDPAEYEESESADREEKVVVDGAAITRVLAEAEDRARHARTEDDAEVVPPDVEVLGNAEKPNIKGATLEKKKGKRHVAKPHRRRKKHPKQRNKERARVKRDLKNTSTGSEGSESEDEHYWAETRTPLAQARAYDPYDLKGVNAPYLADGDQAAKDAFRVKYVDYVLRHKAKMRKRVPEDRVLPQSVVECIRPSLLLYICKYLLKKEYRTENPEAVSASVGDPPMGLEET